MPNRIWELVDGERVPVELAGGRSAGSLSSVGDGYERVSDKAFTNLGVTKLDLLRTTVRWHGGATFDTAPESKSFTLRTAHPRH